MTETGTARWRRALSYSMMCLLAVAFGLVAAPRSDAAVDASIFSGAADQVITVYAPNTESTVAALAAWERGDDGRWQPITAPAAARVGAQGIGATDEFSARTPAGVFPVTESFGRLPDPGTALPYFRTDEQDWWDSNPLSPTYNTHVRRPASPGGLSENLYAEGAVYDYAAVIGYNTARTPAAGSAIFLHVTNGQPTAGCVAVDEDTLVTLLRSLGPAHHPVIAIGVGTAPVPS
ncbi:L,D-transpeptidase family protein [Rhodococcus sp. SGAir0479]|uniref:L,D-transpeptidase family protein n=1 Tax=Rhodococcus sp. SGAir0479 TaxID=2567884 RepID=UPI0020C77B10|nr:L,D-transpeptidase family protein [Rhodococcus sp. SGAir0479]